MNLRRIASSLVTRLIVFGVLLVVFGAVMRYFMLAKFLRDDLTQVIAAQQVTLAEYVAHEVDYKLEQRRRLLERLAATLPRELIAQPPRLQAWLKERHELQPLFSEGLVVADVAGKVIVEFPSIPGRLGFSIADNPDFRAVREGQSLIGRPLVGPVSKKPILPMGAPVRDPAGKVHAVLIGSTALAAPGFLDLLQQGRIGESGGFLLISPRDKLFVAASDPAMVLKPTPPTGRNLLHDRAMEGFRGSGVTVNAKGIEEISAMASVPSAGWFVVARLPTAEALATVARVRTLVITHGFTAVAILLLAVGSLVTWLLRPLHRAAAQAERMTQGEIPLKPLPVVREDEVGHLTAAFNRLLAKLTISQSELVRMAHHDTLTGLPNRQLLADRLQQALARTQRNATRVAVLFLDLDGFKPINDALGHDAGDEALRQITRRLLEVVRQTDTLARLGGDEFILLAADLDEPAEDGVRTLAAKCIAAVARPLRLNEADHTLGVSIGIALCRGHCTAERLLAAADHAMYQAKHAGGSCYAMAPVCDTCQAAVSSHTDFAAAGASPGKFLARAAAPDRQSG